MLVNPKKPLSFRNNTKYFAPDKDKVKVTFSSPHSWQSKCSKTEGYEARLYWHYKYCEDHGGQTFYFTLTYNDRACPQYFGMNVLDYEDLRDLLTGGFRKMLLRKYGTIFKYFVGAELGDGKGTRGMHNNPHYHVLFFLEPHPYTYTRMESHTECVGVYKRSSRFHKKGDSKYVTKYERVTVEVPYTPISEADMVSLVKRYWQGFDETTDKSRFHDYRTAKYGIACPGKFGAKVRHFGACVYCAKYCVKDAALKMHESKVSAALRTKFKDQLKTEAFYKDFFESVINPRFNVPLNPSRTQWGLTPTELTMEYFSQSYSYLHGFFPDLTVLCTFYTGVVKQFCDTFSLWRDFREFYGQRLQELVDEGLTEYRNRYCNKCRISNGVGDYALEEMRGMPDPRVKVPTKSSGFKYRSIPLYYYRKLFTEVIRPISPSCPVHMKPQVLSPIRILNEDGIQYRLRKLGENIVKKREQSSTFLELVLSDKSLYERMRDSDINTDCFLTYDSVCHMVKKFMDYEKTDFCLDYAVYKLVYEGRYYSPAVCTGANGFSSSGLDYRSDYERFIIPSIFSVDRSDIRLENFLHGSGETHVPYSQHPYFYRYRSLFALLDLCNDYFFITSDDKREADAKERQRVKRFFDQRKLKEFYSQFK